MIITLWYMQDNLLTILSKLPYITVICFLGFTLSIICMSGELVYSHLHASLVTTSMRESHFYCLGKKNILTYSLL